MLKIKEIRKIKKMTQNEVVALSGIPKRSYVDYENGKIEPSISKLRDIANALGVDLVELLDVPGVDKTKIDEYLAIENKIPELDDTEFIYNGNGNRYQPLPDGKFIVKVPVVPTNAYARYPTDFQDMEKDDMVEFAKFHVDHLGRGKYMAFEIKGDSMDDDSKRSIPEKSMVLARELKQEHWKNRLNIKKFPYWIIVTEGSILCKEIINHDEVNGTIICHSLNPSPEYSDFKLELNEVKQLLNIIKVQYDVNYE